MLQDVMEINRENESGSEDGNGQESARERERGRSKDRAKAKALLDKYHSGESTAEEKRWLENLYTLYTDSLDFNQEVDFEALELEIYSHLPRPVEKPLWRRLLPYAAALVLMSGVAAFFLFKNIDKGLEPIPMADHIASGGNKAYLTLADGKRIALTGAANGQLAQQSGMEVSKTADGQLVYRSRSKGHGAGKGLTGFNAVETPKGGQYQVTLPDGTNVWLNAASSLRYPASFDGKADRRVELSGEAYFEVAKDKRHPFMVHAAGQQVEVLGTHFNINAYTEEAGVRTTLLEGSVQVRRSDGAGSSQVLKPGQESLLSSSGIRVVAADGEAAIAWKMGYFKFQNEQIGVVMRKISRWYDVQVRYEGQVTDQVLWGTISRYKNVSKVLEMLQATGLVKFRIEGRTIVVMNQ